LKERHNPDGDIMALKILGISSSPRRDGNTDLLVKEALRGAATTGAEVEYVSLCGLAISPCVECYACAATGLCRIDDDYQPIFEKLLAADRLIFASPVFFMAVSAQAKLLIDRCQCLWSRKYLLKEPLYPDGRRRDRRALVIAVGGSRSRAMFDCVRLTMKYWFDVLEMGYFGNLFVNQVDGKGDVLRHPQAVAEAFRLGAALAAAEAPMPAQPTTVELFGPAAGRPGA
jgi:multimeric flavodoxin WrbA